MKTSEKIALMENRINILKQRKDDNSNIITKIQREIKKYQNT